MKSNQDLQKDVQDAIKWEPLLNAAEIGVIAQNGVVTLTGIVNSYAKKLEAEKAAKNVSGVKAVVEEITINYGSYGKKTDKDIADDVLAALKMNWEVPDEKVKIKVENGRVTLEGELKWNYQKEAAKKAIKYLVGITGITNNIQIKSEMIDAVEREDIECALERNWSIDDDDIQVKVSGNNVSLNGTVGSLYQKDEAERIVWNAPGVWSVDNELLVDYES
ncbi:MAG TPA: ornithine aminotransferase [Sphingobacteriaceae bacterium]|nr:ornithine aminotransferase [Sphingobacteriaceae bacterium]